MWHIASIEKFLTNRAVDKAVAGDILSRAREVADERNVFPAQNLERVMGSAELAAEFEKAWETDLDFATTALEAMDEENSRAAQAAR